MVSGLLQPLLTDLACVAGRDQRSGRLVIERVSEFSGFSGFNGFNGFNGLNGVVDGDAAASLNFKL